MDKSAFEALSSNDLMILEDSLEHYYWSKCSSKTSDRALGVVALITTVGEILNERLPGRTKGDRT